MISAIVLNGGIGTRVAAGKPKQFIEIHGQPILAYSLRILDEIPEITEIVMNYPDQTGGKSMVEDVLKQFSIHTPVKIVEPGITRHDSVAAMVSHTSNDSVMIHEAARPMANAKDFLSLINSEHRNVALMQPIPFTVAPVDPENRQVSGSLDRSLLRNVQLPQKFARTDLLTAHQKAHDDGVQFTEDATLVHSYGFPVHFQDGNDFNIKITTPVDLKIAEVLISLDEAEALNERKRLSEDAATESQK